MDATALSGVIDATAAAILEAAALDGLPIRGKLWTLRIEDDTVLLRIQALNNTPQPRQPPPPPPPPPDPEPEPAPPPPPPTDRGSV